MSKECEFGGVVGYDTPLYETPSDAAKRIAELETIIKLDEITMTKLGERIKTLESRINNGVRVYAYIDKYDELAVDMDTEPYGPNATLLRDEV